ncbi:MAG: hypothetical protein PG981_000601 [Wolbachia endosymbiont of Ctenocephalides orientis wCori]|nr:MAG: hypothetical protein PG981_000601 [Wolbachia endosymbiont of Ctenocephalides orientis wCori]
MQQSYEPLQPDHKSTEAAKNVLENIAKSSPEKKRELLELIKNAVEQINIDMLNLRIVDEQGSEKAVKKENFIELINKAFENLESEEIDQKTIELALQCVNDNQTLTNSINKANLDKLTDALKALSTNQKRAVYLGENHSSTSANTRENYHRSRYYYTFSNYCNGCISSAFNFWSAFCKESYKNLR